MAQLRRRAYQESARKPSADFPVGLSGVTMLQTDEHRTVELVVEAGTSPNETGGPSASRLLFTWRICIGPAC